MSNAKTHLLSAIASLEGTRTFIQNELESKEAVMCAVSLTHAIIYLQNRFKSIEATEKAEADKLARVQEPQKDKTP